MKPCHFSGLLVFCLVFFIADWASAQQINLQDLFSSPDSKAEQALPQSPIVAPGAAPTASDYGQLTQPSDPMLGAATDAVDVFRARLVVSLNRVPEIWPAFIATLTGASATGKASYFFGVVLFAALLLMIGRGIGWLYAAFIARPVFVSIQRANPQGYLEKLPVLSYRVLLVALGIFLTV
ncbi:MAG: hypothetical protein AAGA26_06770, partial [Pseudomonadota bacterium]